AGHAGFHAGFNRFCGLGRVRIDGGGVAALFPGCGFSRARAGRPQPGGCNGTKPGPAAGPDAGSVGGVAGAGQRHRCGSNRLDCFCGFGRATPGALADQDHQRAFDVAVQRDGWRAADGRRYAGALVERTAGIAGGRFGRGAGRRLPVVVDAAQHAGVAGGGSVNAIETQGLCARLGDVEILHDITLTLPRARWTSIVGPNGAGKSTLLKALAGLLPHTGRVLLLDRPLADWPNRSRAQQLAWLGQSEHGGDDLTVWDVAMLGRLPHQPWLAPPSPADRAAVEQALRATQAWEWRARSLGQLSG